MKNLKLIAVFTLLALTAPLFAAERIVLDMNDRVYQGMTDLNLKELARRLNGENLMRAELKEVTLVAKSQMGRAQTHLAVGNDRSYTERIYGNPMDFYSDRPATYNHIKLDVFGSSMGEWYLRLSGMVKIKKIVLLVEKRMGPGENNRVTLDFYGRHFTGESLIMLKQELMRERPNLRLANFEIKKVILNAKSRVGRGQATLIVGQDSTYPETIGGRPGDFMSDAPYTYDRVVLNNDTYSDGEGRWQIKLNGNIKIKDIIVVLERKGNNW